VLQLSKRMRIGVLAHVLWVLNKWSTGNAQQGGFLELRKKKAEIIRPVLNAKALAANCRSRCSGIRTSSIHEFCAAWLRTISSVPSVEPSLTITQRAGRCVWASTESIVPEIRSASLRAGVIST
jgi:hypothetical protein